MQATRKRLILHDDIHNSNQKEMWSKIFSPTYDKKNPKKKGGNERFINYKKIYKKEWKTSFFHFFSLWILDVCGYVYQKEEEEKSFFELHYNAINGMVKVE